MKQLTISEFNRCITRPEYPAWKAKKITCIALIGTVETSVKELYEVVVEDDKKWQQTHLYYVQRFKTDKTKENTIILRFRYYNTKNK